MAQAQPNTEKMMRHLYHSQQGSGNIIKEEWKKLSATKGGEVLLGYFILFKTLLPGRRKEAPPQAYDSSEEGSRGGTPQWRQ